MTRETKSNSNLGDWQETYQVEVIPDSTVPLPGGESVERVISEAFERFLITLSQQPPGGVTVQVDMDYKPGRRLEDHQQRLSIFVTITAGDKKTGRMISLALRKGLIGDYYLIKCKRTPKLSRKRFKACCSVLVKEDLLTSPFGADLNSKIPQCYYTRQPFQPCSNNTFSLLDRVLDTVGEHVLIEKAVQPVEVSQEQKSVAAYTASLEEINRYRSSDWEDGSQGIDYFCQDEGRISTRGTPLELPKQKDPVADSVSRNIQRLRENLEQPQLLFQFRVWAETVETAQHIASVAAQCVFLEGSYRLVTIETGDDLWEMISCSATAGRFISPFSRGLEASQSEPRLYLGFERLAQMASVEELVAMYRFPIGGYDRLCCIRQSTDPPNLQTEQMILLGYEAEPRNSQRSISNRSSVGAGIDFLNRHWGVFGKSGSGKTWALCLFFIGCVMANIPVIFYSPIRAEHLLLLWADKESDPRYREVACRIRVYTAGRDHVSPFRFNPLQRHPGVTLEEHKERLLESVKASIPTFPALETCLGEGLSDVYRRYPDIGCPPIFEEWLDATQRAYEHHHYKGELRSNLDAAIQVRLASLREGAVGSIFRTRHSTPSISDLLHGTTIIKFEGLSEEHTSLITHLHMNYLRQEVTTTKWKGNGIRLVFLFDEVHVVAGPNDTTSPSDDSVNVAAQASKVLTRFLAEMRKFRVAAVLADQRPRNVNENVVSIPGSLMALWSMEKNDREILGNSMNMSEYELNELALLQKGEAFLMTEDYPHPRKIRTPTPPKFMLEAMPPTDEELRQRIEREEWFQRDYYFRRRGELDLLKDRMNDFDASRIDLFKQIENTRERHNRRLAHKPPTAIDVDKSIHELNGLHMALLKLIEQFKECSYLNLLGGYEETDPEDIKKACNDLHNRFELIIEPQTKACLEMIQKIIEQWEKIRT